MASTGYRTAGGGPPSWRVAPVPPPFRSRRAPPGYGGYTADYRLPVSDSHDDVRWRTDIRNEKFGQRNFYGQQIPKQSRVQLGKPESLITNGRKEYRIVKDNRINTGDQSTKSVPKDVKGNDPENLISEVQENVAGEKLSGFVNTADPCHMKEKESTAKVAVGSELENSVDELYSSADPVHVPSPGRSSGTAGAIRCELRVEVGKLSLDHGSNSSDSSMAAPINKVDSSREKSAHPGFISNNNGYVQHAKSDGSPLMKMRNGKSQSVICSKVTWHLEWKPKARKNISSVDVSSDGAHSAAPSTPNCLMTTNQLEVDVLPEKLLSSDDFDDKHVTIPEHLRIAECEDSHIIFGSFDFGLDSTSNSTSDSTYNPTPDLNEVKISEGLNGQPPTSTEALTVMSSVKSFHSFEQQSVLNSQLDTLPLVPTGSLPEFKMAFDSMDKAAVAQITGTSEGSSSFQSHQLQYHDNNSTMQNTTLFETDAGYDMSFLNSSADDEMTQNPVVQNSVFQNPMVQNSTFQNPAVQNEVIHSYPAFTNQLSTSAPSVQQTAAQFYPPQVQMQHYQTNFLPYRHMYPQVYLPPGAMTNYSGGTAYAQHAQGGNYLLLPAGGPHVPGTGMKYGSTQYKAVYGGNSVMYGSFSNQNGYSIDPSPIGNMHTIDDTNRMKYRENSFYATNLQGENTDLWMQAPREILNLPSSPFYNVSGPAPSPQAAYMPSLNGHVQPSFSAAAPQTSQLQYPGMAPILQQGSMALIQSSHAMVQPVPPPGLAGNMGVTAMAPGGQGPVAAFQHSQHAHLGWTGNY